MTHRRLRTFTAQCFAWVAGLAQAGPPPSWIEPTTDMPFVAIPAACFEMGNPDALAVDTSDYPLIQAGFDGRRFADEAPVHTVCTDAFWIAQLEVTAEQWHRVMGEWPPHGRGRQPAAGVSWQQVQQFARRLDEHSDGFHFRLPTEAEWEHACRLASPEAAPEQREDLLPHAWFNTRSRRAQNSNAVGQLAANAYGIHDMLGNVWEWTLDHYSPEAYAGHSRRNPQARDATEERVIRGGSYRSDWQEIRCTSRSSYPLDAALPQLGFRLVRIHRP